MTKQEAFDAYYDEIRYALASCTEDAMRSRGRIHFGIYCWQDDGVEIVEEVAGKRIGLPAKRGCQKVWLMTTVDVGMDYDPADDMVVEYDAFDPDDSDEGEEDLPEVSYLEEDAVESIVSRIDWDEKMEEIREDLYYEEV